jgi:hypothetical protein
MGAAGGSFAQGFVNTLVQGQQIIQANQARREELDLRKKLIGAQLQEHDAKTQLATRKLEAITGLRERMTGSWGEEEGAGFMPAAPLSEGERLNFASALDPDAAAKSLLSGDKKVDVASLFKQFTQGGGEEQPQAPQPSAAPTEAPAEAPAPAGGQPATSQQGMGPQRKLDRTMSMSVGDDGKVKVEFKVGERNVAFKVDHEAEVLPDGRVQNYRLVTNPEDPRQMQRVPVGAPQWPAAMQTFAATATSWGLKPGSDLHAAAVADQAAISTMFQPGRPQEIAYQQLAEKYRGIATTPATPQQAAVTGKVAPGADPRAQADAAEVKLAEDKAAAAARGDKSVPKNATPAERKEMQEAMSTIDLYNQIGATYKPEYVGPSLKGLVSGGVSAKIRERTGVMSQGEQTFRTNLALANNKLIREMAGANVPEGEMARASKQLADADTLPPKQFEARFATAKLYAKATAIRKRQIDEATGVDVSKVPRVTLTTEERRALAEPILAEYDAQQITKEEAVTQLMGLSGFSELGAIAFLGAQGPGSHRARGGR